MFSLPTHPNTNVVSAVVTGGHGSGIHNQAIANYVTELIYIDALGRARTLKRNYHGELFYQFLHSFGTLGIIVELKLEITKAYYIKKCIYEQVPWNDLLTSVHFDNLNYRNDYV